MIIWRLILRKCTRTLGPVSQRVYYTKLSANLNGPGTNLCRWTIAEPGIDGHCIRLLPVVCADLSCLILCLLLISPSPKFLEAGWREPSQQAGFLGQGPTSLH